MNISIRQANIADASAIAQVHVDSWRSTYKGIISSEYLADLKVENREKNWVWGFRNPNQDETVWVAVDDGGTVIAFANGGKCLSEEYGYEGELYSIYINERYQGQGIGKRLMGEVVSALTKNGYTSMMIWVLESNPSAAFYRKLGGEPVARKEIMIGHDTLIEVAYAWNNLKTI